MISIKKFTDDPLVVCPECGEPALRKVYQPVGIVFKGKGFYATDNRSPSGQTYSSESHEHGKKESTESKAEPKTESKSTSTALKTTKIPTDPLRLPIMAAFFILEDISTLSSNA